MQFQNSHAKYSKLSSLEKRRLRRQKPCLHAAHCSVSVLSGHGGSFTFCVYLCLLDDEHTIDLRFLAMCWHAHVFCSNFSLFDPTDSVPAPSIGMRTNFKWYLDHTGTVGHKGNHEDDQTVSESTGYPRRRIIRPVRTQAASMILSSRQLT